MTDKKWKRLLIGIGLLFMGFTIGYLVGNSPAVDGKRVLSVSDVRESSALKDTISLNAATKEDLMRLPRIGAKMAERIIEYRESQGGFRSLEELKNVEGIGDKTYERIVPFLTL